MDIKVIGPGCINCQMLEMMVINVLAKLGVAANVDKVTDRSEFVKYGVFGTPGLVINGNLKVAGRVPIADEVRKWIEEEL
jgi:small redox-active disulfide protein 2